MTEVEEKTEFEFSELSDCAKDKAREQYRGGNYPEYDWWDSVYEDATRMGALMGVHINTTTRKTRLGRDIHEIDISFSGFWSQGDGASFAGGYQYVPDAIGKIKAECNDEELLRIASELTILQLTRRLQGKHFFGATVTKSGRFSHSGGMDANVNVEDEDEDEDITGLEEDVTRLMRDFADWIYRQLKDEYDYLTSDECIDQYLNDSDDLYDEDGRII